jgi:D-3-phosphoglycerate dehydrogenase
MFYADRPGIVAIYGQEFGEAGINIAGMQIARRSAGGQALSIITVDSPVPDEVLERVRVAIEADEVREIDIVEV